jgi:hypothetical protein
MQSMTIESFQTFIATADEEKEPNLLERLVQHCAHWDEHNEIQTLQGEEVSESMLTWYACATAIPDTTDDPRKLEDFPLIQLHESWIHDPLQISRMYMRDTMDLLEGLEWHVFSDMFFRHRTNAWWKQVMELFHLLVHRCFQFAQGEWDTTILNVEEYRLVRKLNLLEPVDEDPEKKLDGYRSDDEEGLVDAAAPPKKKRKKPDPTASSTDLHSPPNEAPKPMRTFYKEIATVSTTWLYDVDSITSFFWQCAFGYEQYPLPPGIPDIDLASFRDFIFAQIQLLKEDETIRFRRVWYEDLLVVESYRRVYKRKSPLNERPASREVIIFKKDELYTVDCTTIQDIITKQVGEDPLENNQHLRISTDAMFFLYTRSLSNTTGNVCQAVFRKTRKEALAAKSYPCIFRNEIRNVWEVMLDAGTRMYGDSFSLCFAYMRKWMKDHGKSPMKGQVDFSALDVYFFPGE